ncbi:MAG: hypothetical protein SPL22_06790 [Treponema sp.]|uniref:hypothetical protein n=1 Tax=Treponema sp. TaxID=166 RepID=UPI002A910E44|nr:hypothetical protein [Treponema sp.]MDY6397423.1 hypothetical protein [Treponema sp.]
MKKFFCVSLVAALSLLLFSCSNFFSSSSSDNESAPNGKARVHFSIGKSDARTIMPEIYTEEDISLVELTAQKISEGEATVYKLDGKNEKLSWTSLADLENFSIDIDYGTYTFVLNLSIEDEEENKTVLVQTCTLENQEINADTKELVFNMKEDSGDVSIAVSWKLRDETNRIGKIKAGLYTIASNGETTIGISDAEKTLTIKGADTSVTATGSYASVPSGSYLIKLFLYDSESSTTPFNTITDIIKVNGYKTNYVLPLEFANLNLQYNVTFNPNGGLWEGVSEDSITTTRNMYSGFIPPKEISKDGFVLVGWYSFEGDEPSEDLSQGISSDAIMIGPEMGARDYTFYAIWGKQAGGNLSTDNRALIIKTDAGNTIYQNSKINLSVTDSAGESVTDSITYAAKILYKGQDINELGGKTYYSVDETQGVITLNGKTTPLPEANYQLYVTASRNIAENNGNQVTSSQSFDVELVDGLAAPETRVALYNYVSDDMSGSYYHFYLTDSENVETAILDGTANFSVEEYGVNGIAFDATGNFYINPSSYYTTIKSNNTKFSESGVSFPAALSDYSAYCGFAIDMIKNVAYAWGMNSPDPGSSESLHLIKCPNLISNGDTTDSIEFEEKALPNNFTIKNVSVSNNVLYAYGIKIIYDAEDPTVEVQRSPYMVVFDISSGSSCKDLEPEPFDVGSYLTNTVHLSSNASVTDVFAMEGAVYLLVSERDDGSVGSKDIYRRGTVIKYVPPKNGKGSVKDFIPLKTTKSVSDTGYSKMCLGYQSHPMYLKEKDEADNDIYTTPIIVDGLTTQYDNTKTAQSEFFPNVYALSKNWNEEEFSLSSPAKVIAVKPKKLVIADDGIAFYVDTDGSLAFKNINRVVTINLERFVIESIQATKAGFVEVSDVYTTGIPVKGIFASGWNSNGLDGSTVWYESTTNMFSDVSLTAETNDVYFAAKKGTE